MKIDKYTKFVLTIIAVGVIALNLNSFNLGFVDKAHAVGNGVAVAGLGGKFIYIVDSTGSYGCKVGYGAFRKSWSKIPC